MNYGEEIKICIDIIIKNKFPEYFIKSFLVFGIDYYTRCNLNLKSEQIFYAFESYKAFSENPFSVEENSDLIINK